MKRLNCITKEFKDIKKQHGSITIEATIFLVLFMCFYILMMDLVQIAKAQVVLQYSINEVAKEISVYSYVFTKAGMVDKRIETSEKASELRGTVTDVIDFVTGVKDTNSLEDVVNNINFGKDIINNFPSQDELMNQFFSMAKEFAVDGVSNLAIDKLVKNEVSKQIGLINGGHTDVDTYLRNLGIVDGLEGLDFTGSVWAKKDTNGNMPVVDIALSYEMNYDLGFIKVKPRKFKLHAKTGLW